MRFVIFIATFMAVLALVYGYVGLRISSILPNDLRVRFLFWAFIVVLWGLEFVAPYLFRISVYQYPAWVEVLQWVNYSSLGFFVLAFFAFLFLEPVRTAFIFKNIADAERRNFLVACAGYLGFGSAGLAALAGTVEGLKLPSITHIPISLKNLPHGFKGFRIVQISDLHIGPLLRKEFTEKIVGLVQALHPDLIVVTGDVIDGTVDQLKEQVAPLAKLSAPYGVLLCTGNHEYYWGVSNWLSEFRSLGLQPLVNEHVVVEKEGDRLVVAGVPDLHGGQFLEAHTPNATKALAGAPTNTPKIVLAHQPKSAEDSALAGFDLQLSGHTHGGQFLPFRWLVFAAQPYLEGLHRHRNLWVYVNRGTGFWGPPIRIGATSEITEITLI